jgi:hypothetical protein
LSSGGRDRKRFPDYDGDDTIFSQARQARKQHFPGSLTRNLYRKKIPEIVKMVDMVPGVWWEDAMPG